jgi:hypothetical protein
MRDSIGMREDGPIGGPVVALTELRGIALPDDVSAAVEDAFEGLVEGVVAARAGA